MDKLILVALMVGAMAAAGQEGGARVARGAVAEGGHKASTTLGKDGAWLIGSAERWEATLKSLAAAGVKIEDNLGAVDWAKENLACVFHYGDEADQFSVRFVGGDAAVRELQVLMTYVTRTQQRALAMGVWKVFATPVAKAAATKVSVMTFQPMNGGQNVSKEQAALEWEWTFSDKTGEAVGGLTGTIEPRAAAVKAGEDVALKFTLSLAGAAKGKEGRFAPGADAVAVWDGKYSNGYRNHGFEVLTPDGKLLALRPKVINEWGKNAPHPVTITPGRPYVLPNWAEEVGYKSLKEMGLDTSKAGVYVVTGVYQETGGASAKGGPDLWGGVVRTNTVRVEVK